MGRMLLDTLVECRGTVVPPISWRKVDACNVHILHRERHPEKQQEARPSIFICSERDVLCAGCILVVYDAELPSHVAE